MLKHIVFIIFMSLEFSACFTQPKIKVYSGPDLPIEEIVVLTVSPNIEVLSINGKKQRTYEGGDMYQLLLPPGKTQLIAYYRELVGDATLSVIAASNKHRFEFESVPGSKYKLVVQIPISAFKEQDNIANSKLWMESENVKIEPVQVIEYETFMDRLFKN